MCRLFRMTFPERDITRIARVGHVGKRRATLQGRRFAKMEMRPTDTLVARNEKTCVVYGHKRTTSFGATTVAVLFTTI